MCVGRGNAGGLALVGYPVKVGGSRSSRPGQQMRCAVWPQSHHQAPCPSLTDQAAHTLACADLDLHHASHGATHRTPSIVVAQSHHLRCQGQQKTCAPLQRTSWRPWSTCRTFCRGGDACDDGHVAASTTRLCSHACSRNGQPRTSSLGASAAAPREPPVLQGTRKQENEWTVTCD